MSEQLTDGDIRVISHSGYRGEERPTVLIIDSRTVAVAEVLARSVSEERDSGRTLRRFTILGSDGETYLLRHDEALGEWALDE